MRYLILLTPFLLNACLGSSFDFTTVEKPTNWRSYQSSTIKQVEAQQLEKWWQKFQDPNLNALIVTAFENSPERRIAEARILEARGIRKTTRSSLFPEIGVSVNAGREKTGLGSADYYDASFDASYEVDLFGQNRNATRAANENIRSLEANYYDVTLSLIAEISRDYVDYRRFQKQARLSEKNLELQEKTLELVKVQKKFGEAPQLNVEQAENLVNTTKASIPEFIRLADNARLRLSVLTGELPETLELVLSDLASIPTGDASPVLLAPADVVSLRPDVQAAIANLKASSALSDAAIASIFPTFTLAGFYGLAEGVLFNSTSIWNVTAGAAVSLLNFGRIQGQIDAAEAVEMRAFEAYRLSVLRAVTEVETALNDYARFHEQSVYLSSAYNNANKALELSQILYREGEVDFINVLDAQRSLNTSDAALITAKAEKTQSLIRLYKSLGVY